MAAVDTGNNPNDPNNPNNQPGNINQPGQQTNQPATTSGAGGVTATGAGNVTGQVVGTSNPSQPFQNISSYLAANAPQSKDLATQVAGTVSAPITQAQTGITNAAQDFTQSVNAGYTPANNELITAVSNNPAYVVAENPDNVTNFLAQLNNKYTGPTDFTQGAGYSDLQGKIAAAQAQAANTENESGIQTLLKSVEGPTTAGINKLDSLLLSADPENYQTIKAAGTGAANLLPTLNQTTAEQNALAATGATTASKTAADSLAALNTARGSESTNLTNEQNSIQDIVNQYNKSVGIINPVVQNITQAIQDFLASNPNVKFQPSGDPLADIRNLSEIAMPEMAAYASPQDYAQIAALMQLGDTNVGNLPINSSTANLAQTFNVPTALRDAVGKAPGVQSALSNELMGIGNTINSAVQPYQDLLNSEMRRADVVQKAQAIQTQLPALQKQVAQMEQNAATMGQPHSGYTPQQAAAAKADLDAAKAKLAQMTADLKTYTTSPDYHIGNYWDQLAQMAQGLQWVDGTETSYQQLVDAINAQLGQLGNVGVPNFSYNAPNAPIQPGAPIGGATRKQLEQSVIQAAPAAGAAGVAAGIGAGGAAAAAADLTAGAVPGGIAFTPAEQLAIAGETGATSALAAIPPAALAAYGTQNIVTNAQNNPYRIGNLNSIASTGLEVLGNMGTLGLLSLPPQIFTSIGKGIKDVINSIGDFFGGLF